MKVGRIVKYLLLLLVVGIVLYHVIGLLLWFFAPENSVTVDYSVSHENFEHYYNEVEALFRQKGYDFEVSKYSNYEKRDANRFDMLRLYALNERLLCSIMLINQNGHETFSIAFDSPHVTSEDYEYVELVHSTTSLISGHEFTEKDFRKLLKGGAGFRFHSMKGNDLLKGYRTHNRLWVGIRSDWAANYIVDENHPWADNWGVDAVDTFEITGFTKTGTMK